MAYDRRTYQTAYLRRYRNRRKRAAIEALGGKCEKCGNKNVIFARKNPLENSKMNTMWTAPESRLQEELSLCTLLCGSCWRERRKTHGRRRSYPLTHGTAFAVLKRKCQCEVCSDPDLIKRYKEERNRQERQYRKLRKAKLRAAS